MIDGSEDGTRSGPLPLVMVGGVAGFLGGGLGVGGGFVMVPLLAGLLRFGQHRAHATSLAAIVLIAASGAIRFGIAGQLVWAVGVAVGVGGVLGSTIGAHVMHRLSPVALRLAFGAIMVVAGLRMVLGGQPEAGQAPEALVGALLGVGVGVVAGIASGVAGIGGGAIIVPALVLALGLDQHAAEGTSLLAILFGSIAGTRVHLENRRVRVRDALVVGLAGVIFAQLGASAALALPGDVLAGVFGVFVSLVGARMLLSAYRSRQGAAQ